VTENNPTLVHARAFLKKAEEYLASAVDNFDLERYTACSGDAVHAGIAAKDAIVTALTGSTSKSKDHSAAASELRTALGQREGAAAAERALRDLVGAKTDVEYSAKPVTAAAAKILLRRARTLVEWARLIVQGGQ
jgi:HEPN domain-containing protein